MPLLARIAVIGVSPSALAARLSALPERPVVRPFQDLVGEIDRVVAFQPRALVFEHEHPTAEDAGALRLVAALLPGLELVIASPRAREAEVRPLAQRLGATFLALPADEDELLAALSSLRGGRADLAPLLDLVRGLADEINNPLQQALGHLQLLRAQIDAAAEPDRATQARAADEGLRRIAGTLARLDVLARAGAPRSPAVAVPLAQALAEALDEVARERGGRPAVTAPPAPDLHVHGDPQLVRTMLAELIRGAVELARAAAGVEVAAGADERGVWVRALVELPPMAEWRLPELYAPYYLTRAMRGSRQGLALFVAQTIAHALGGEATARRSRDRTLELELVLPVEAA